MPASRLCAAPNLRRCIHRLQDDFAERLVDADQIARAFREADSFEPDAGEADFWDFAARARVIGLARRECSRGDDAGALAEAKLRRGFFGGRTMVATGRARWFAGFAGHAVIPLREVTDAERGGDGAAQG